MDDLISRQAAVDALSVGKKALSRVLDEIDVVGTEREKYSWGLGLIESSIKDIEALPSAQPDPIKITIDHAPTPDELERLKQAMRNTPVMLLPSAQPEIIPKRVRGDHEDDASNN